MTTTTHSPTTTHSLVTLTKRLDCKCGISLIPNKVYSADWDEEFSRWKIVLDNGLFVIVLPKNIKEFLTAD